jgi:hypothetical protein
MIELRVLKTDRNSSLESIKKIFLADLPEAGLKLIEAGTIVCKTRSKLVRKYQSNLFLK